MTNVMTRLLPANVTHEGLSANLRLPLYLWFLNKLTDSLQKMK